MARRKDFSPAIIDALVRGKLADPATPGLSIKVGPGGKKAWHYRRRIVGGGPTVKLTLGLFPAYTIAAARQWASELNEQVEAGIDPRAVKQAAIERARMTVEFCHGLYMTAVREGRASRAKRVNKPSTIAEKLAIYGCDIAPKLGRKVIYDVTEADLTKLVLAKGKRSRVRANRLATELKVFFAWASSLRGTEIGLPGNPAARLTDLRFAETPRARKLSAEEIGWFLRALAHEPRTYQRGFLLFLLTAARLSEVIGARTRELQDDVWTIPENRAKNARAHRVVLGAWRLSLFRSNHEWASPLPASTAPRRRAAGTSRAIASFPGCQNMPGGRSSDGRLTICDAPPARTPSASKSISRPPRPCSTTQRQVSNGSTMAMNLRTRSANGF